MTALGPEFGLFGYSGLSSFPRPIRKRELGDVHKIIRFYSPIWRRPQKTMALDREWVNKKDGKEEGDLSARQR